MNEREALKLALDALYCSDDFLFDYHECEPHDERKLRRYEHARTQNIKAIDAIRKVLAQPKREWVGLDDEDMKELRDASFDLLYRDANFDLLYGARWAERKLRETNS